MFRISCNFRSPIHCVHAMCINNIKSKRYKKKSDQKKKDWREKRENNPPRKYCRKKGRIWCNSDQRSLGDCITLFAIFLSVSLFEIVFLHVHVNYISTLCTHVEVSTYVDSIENIKLKLNTHIRFIHVHSASFRLFRSLWRSYRNIPIETIIKHKPWRRRAESVAARKRSEKCGKHQSVWTTEPGEQTVERVESVSALHASLYVYNKHMLLCP